MPATIKRFCLNHLELLVSTGGVGAILLVPILIASSTEGIGQVAAITAVGVGLVLGCIFWLVRRQQGKKRHEVSNGIRLMLRERIHNDLMIFATQLEIDLKGGDAANVALIGKKLEPIMERLQAIPFALEKIFEESLRRWKFPYRKV